MGNFGEFTAVSYWQNKYDEFTMSVPSYVASLVSHRSIISVFLCSDEEKPLCDARRFY